MVDPWDEFFIGRIKEGLAQSSESLSSEEEDFLRSPVSDLENSPILNPEKGQELQVRCTSALATAYRRDTAEKAGEGALQWREHNEALYKHSKLVISGIVQNWYLGVGRTLEKKATGWTLSRKVTLAFTFSLVGIVFGLFAWIGFAMAIIYLREMRRRGESTQRGLAIAAAIIGGIWGPVRSLMHLIAKSGILQ